MNKEQDRTEEPDTKEVPGGKQSWRGWHLCGTNALLGGELQSHLTWNSNSIRSRKELLSGTHNVYQWKPRLGQRPELLAKSEAFQGCLECALRSLMPQTDCQSDSIRW